MSVSWKTMMDVQKNNNTPITRCYKNDVIECLEFILCACVCVCVSTPGQRVCHRHSFQRFSTTFHGQGGSDPFSSHCLTKTLLIGCDIRRGRSPNVPAEFSTRCHPTLPLFDSWFFMLPPPNRFSHRRPAAALPLCAFRSHV